MINAIYHQIDGSIEPPPKKEKVFYIVKETGVLAVGYTTSGGEFYHIDGFVKRELSEIYWLKKINNE